MPDFLVIFRMMEARIQQLATISSNLDSSSCKTLNAMLTRLYAFSTVLLMCASFVLGARAQTDEHAVRETIQTMFDGMRAGDSSLVRVVLHSDARFLTTGERDGQPFLQEGGVEGFVQAVGTPHQEVWDERISNVTIQIDDRLAAAWMDYSFYLGETFSHCGVNAFQLFKTSDGWRIIQITDTRRIEQCAASDEP